MEKSDSAVARKRLPPEAFSFYCSLGENRSLAAVAARYGVTVGTVAAAARRDGWLNRVGKIVALATARAEAGLLDILTKQMERDLITLDEIETKAMDAFRRMRFETQRDVLAALKLVHERREAMRDAEIKLQDKRPTGTLNNFQQVFNRYITINGVKPDEMPTMAQRFPELTDVIERAEVAGDGENES